jgi:hypothetical protein
MFFYRMLFIITASCILIIAANRLFARYWHEEDYPWLGRIYQGESFDGPPHVIWLRQLNYYNNRPFEDTLPRTEFSAIFSSCLIFVDQHLVIDNWGYHPNLAMQGSRVLEPGSHLITVFFMQKKQNYSLILKAGTSGRPRSYLDSHHLSRPTVTNNGAACSQ